LVGVVGGSWDLRRAMMVYWTGVLMRVSNNNA